MCLARTVGAKQNQESNPERLAHLRDRLVLFRFVQCLVEVERVPLRLRIPAFVDVRINAGNKDVNFSLFRAGISLRRVSASV